MTALRLYRATVEVDVVFLSDGRAPEFDAIGAAEEAMGDGSNSATAHVRRLGPGDKIGTWSGCLPYGWTPSRGDPPTVDKIMQAMRALALLGALLGVVESREPRR